MRTILSPAYIRPVVVVKNEAAPLRITRKEMRLERELRSCNILSYRDKRAELLIAFLGNEGNPLHEQTFICLVAKMGYDHFLPLAGGYAKMRLFLEMPQAVEEKTLAALFKNILPRLRDAREEFAPFLERALKASSSSSSRRRAEIILEAWSKAAEYGLRHHFAPDENGLPVHIMEGKDIRAAAYIAVAQRLEHGLPLPVAKRCCSCGGFINPFLYEGSLYCSDRCRRLAQKKGPERAALQAVKDRVRVKSHRLVERGELPRKAREDLLRELQGASTMRRAEAIARKYGVNPGRDRPGRPRKSPPATSRREP